MKVAYGVLIAFVIFTSLNVQRGQAADPCGLVPPVRAIAGKSWTELRIKRRGVQQTYVFYDKGIESIVLRPEFEGKVEEFGMLVPFPSPPIIRKVRDDVFDHIRNAIDPPEHVVEIKYELRDFNRRRMRGRSSLGAGGAGAAGLLEGGPAAKRKDRLVVLNQEAIGMYEVAVLEAGSARALKKWMDSNQFRYPEGMDDVCDEYIADHWCFVAVKAKIGESTDASPKAGKRTATVSMPQGATFSGAVQGLGFRFESKELVVPMRLSTFNGNDARNIVYLLTRGRKKIRFIPEEYVVRQIPGQKLARNLSLKQLPLRLIGIGHPRDIPKHMRPEVKASRVPWTYFSEAKELFSSDVLVAKHFESTGELLGPVEKQRKELRKIGAHLELSGNPYEQLVGSKQLQVEKQFADAKAWLEGFTMTVIDGKFPQEVLAEQNLTFERFPMARRLNSKFHYDAKLLGPASKPVGRLFVDSEPTKGIIQQRENVEQQEVAVYGFACLLLLLIPLRQRK